MHYRERALEGGVPDEVIRVEPKARNTGENMTLTCGLLTAEGVTPESVTLVSRSYQERRAFATCRELWPELDAENGYAIHQDVPHDVQAAYQRLVDAGYTRHLVSNAA